MSEYKDREQTKQFMLNVTKQVLNINWLEQLRATLNYAPILVIRELPKLCEAPKEPPVVETIWKGTYIKLLDVNNLFHINYSTLHTDNLKANPIEYLLCYREEESFGDSELPDYLGGYEGYGGGNQKYPIWEAIHSLIDVNDNVYDITSYGSATTIETDFMLNGKLLTMDDLTKGIKGQFIADTSNSTTQFKTYSGFFGGGIYDSTNWDSRPEPIYATYSSYIGFYGLENDGITINDIPINEFSHDKLVIQRKSDRTIIYYNADDNESLFLKVGSNISPISTTVFTNTTLNKGMYVDMVYRLTDTISTMPITVRLFKPENLDIINAFLNKTNGNQGSDTTNPDTPPPIPPETNELPEQYRCNTTPNYAYIIMTHNDVEFAVPLYDEAVGGGFYALSQEDTTVGEFRKKLKAFAEKYDIECRNLAEEIHVLMRFFMEDEAVKPMYPMFIEKTTERANNMRYYDLPESEFDKGRGYKLHNPDKANGNVCERGWKLVDGICIRDYSYCNTLEFYPLDSANSLFSGDRQSDKFNISMDYVGNKIVNITMSRKDNPDFSATKPVELVPEHVMVYLYKLQENKPFRPMPISGKFLPEIDSIRDIIVPKGTNTFLNDDTQKDTYTFHTRIYRVRDLPSHVKTPQWERYKYVDRTDYGNNHVHITYATYYINHGKFVYAINEQPNGQRTGEYYENANIACAISASHYPRDSGQLVLTGGEWVDIPVERRGTHPSAPIRYNQCTIASGTTVPLYKDRIGQPYYTYHDGTAPTEQYKYTMNVDVKPWEIFDKVIAVADNPSHELNTVAKQFLYELVYMACDWDVRSRTGHSFAPTIYDLVRQLNQGY